MTANYLFFNYNCDLAKKYLFRILCAVFIAQINHYGKFTALHKFFSIVLKIDESNQVKISRVIMGCQGYYSKIALGTRLGLKSP